MIERFIDFIVVQLKTVSIWSFHSTFGPMYNSPDQDCTHSTGPVTGIVVNPILPRGM